MSWEVVFLDESVCDMRKPDGAMRVVIVGMRTDGEVCREAARRLRR